jgi:Predicted transcriptional regulators
MTRQAVRSSNAREGETHSANLAKIVKAVRRQAGLTLNELAAAADVSASTISKIESGQLSPGYEIIIKLARGLDVDVAQLFRSDTTMMPTGRRSVTRNGEGTFYDSANYQYEVLAGDLSRKQFVPLKTVVKAGEIKEFGAMSAHEGEEFVYVLTGRIVLRTEHYEPLVLEPGDSVYFDSRSGHALLALGEDDASVLWICSNPNTLSHLRDAD